MSKRISLSSLRLSVFLGIYFADLSRDYETDCRLAECYNF